MGKEAGRGGYLLCIDIGNTNVVLGLYAVDSIGGKNGPCSRWRIATDHDRLPDEYGILLVGLLEHEGYGPQDVLDVAIASVVPPLTRVFREVSRRYFGHKPFILDGKAEVGLKIAYDSPRDVGADRIADAVAARQLYGTPACIVDFGTATTFDALSAEGDYIGGAIAPGIGIAAEALFSRTAKLPRVDLVCPPGPIGTNTVHAIQSGLLFGYVSLVEGMVGRFREVLGPDTKVIATGGLAEVIARETDVMHFTDLWLTLEGLRIIYTMNRGTNGLVTTP